ncbi:electron transfer flavoprotein subunit alpha/FixB family protein [soil metagenome]
MTRVLIVAEHDGEHVNPSTAKCVTCAQGLEPEAIDVVVFASGGDAVAAEAAGLEGVTRVLQVDRAENSAPLAAVLAPQIAALAEDYTHVLGPSTTFGKDVMPRAAALLGVGQVSDIMAVEGPRRFTRPIYAGNAIVTVEVPEDGIVVGTVRAASFEAAGSGGSAEIERTELDAELPTHTRYVGLEGGQGDRPDLQTATRVVAGGRALGSGDNFDLLFRLADKLGAAVGASRAAVDAGYVPNDMQVGQTGKIIAPELYIAVGISGAIQHLTGIKDAGTIVAINKDADAPIFEVADIGVVGDLFELVPEIEKLIGSG